MLRRTIALLAILAVLGASGMLGLGCAPGPIESYPPGGSKGRVDLLIITHQKLLPEVEKLAAFKTQSGLRTAVVTTSGIDSNYSGTDLPEKMRNCAIHYWKSGGTTALLLVGSSSLIPTRYVFCPNRVEEVSSQQGALDIEKARKNKDTVKYERYFVPTDLYFANFLDDWDINRNGVYGEVAALTGLDRDEGGFSSQIAVGRIPVRNTDDLASVVRKIMKYKPLEPRTALFVSATKDMGGEFDGDQFCDHIISGLEGEWATRVVSEGQPDCNAADILGLLNRGKYSLVAGVTHGFPFGIVIDSIRRLRVLDSHEVSIADWKNILLMCEAIENSDWYRGSLEPTLLDTRMVRKLNNTMPFFFIGFGCYISNFDYRPHYSIVEQLVLQENGAIAACGMSTIVGVSHKEYLAALQGTGGLQFEIGDLLIMNLCNGRLTFGQALGNAREEYARRNSTLMSSSDHRGAVFGMTLIGDPTLHLLR